MRISKRLKHYSILIGGLFTIFSTVVNFTDNLLKFHYIENLYGTDSYYNYSQPTVASISHETNLDAVLMIFIIVLTLTTVISSKLIMKESRKSKKLGTVILVIGVTYLS